MAPNKFIPKLPQDQLPRGEIEQALRPKRDLKRMSPSKGPGAFGLGIAKVIRVDEIEHEITLQVMSGEDDLYQRVPIPSTYAGAGPRHLLAAIPTEGSYCIIGYLSTTPKQPVILSWILPGVLAGMDWLPVQDFLPTELDLTPKLRAEAEGIFGRHRHKLRAARKGMILASSAQGSDLVLDEGVLLTNRRCTELRLRDQDQAVVLRSLQQFHVLGGIRLYAGMVQRDGTLLPTSLISDGSYWAAPKQMESGVPIPGPLLGADPNPQGAYAPHPFFFKTDPTGPWPASGKTFDANLDPYELLRRGLFLGPDGYVQDASATKPSAEYGGKPLYRVSLDQGVNAVTDATAETLTEWRLELDHTWDGTLPVSEQTEGFDVDRLPSESVDETSPLSARQRFITFVLGSVVGNDSMTATGRGQYGIPLRPEVLGTTGPKLLPALGAALGEHAASLLRIQNPLDPKAMPTMVSFTKDGRLRAFISGQGTEDSVQIQTTGGVRLDAGGPIQLGGQALELNFPDNTPGTAFAVKANKGAVVLQAGGPVQEGKQAAQDNPGLSPSGLPSLLLEAKQGNAKLSAQGQVAISGSEIALTNAAQISVVTKGALSEFADKIVQQCTTLDRAVLGREDTVYSGPKKGLPSNAPLRKIVFAASPATGHVGGDTDIYKMNFGDRKETFTKGSHETQVQVGNLTYKTSSGTFEAGAGSNSIKLSSTTGLSATVTTGTISMTSSQSLSLKSTTFSKIESSGPTTVQGSVVILKASASKTGSIICSSDLDPLSGLPLSTFGMGSTGHLLSI